MTITCACGQRVEHFTALLEHWKAKHNDQALKPHLLLWGKVEIFGLGTGE